MRRERERCLCPRLNIMVRTLSSAKKILHGTNLCSDSFVAVTEYLWDDLEYRAWRYNFNTKRARSNISDILGHRVQKGCDVRNGLV